MKPDPDINAQKTTTKMESQRPATDFRTGHIRYRRKPHRLHWQNADEYIPN